MVCGRGKLQLPKSTVPVAGGIVAGGGPRRRAVMPAKLTVAQERPDPQQQPLGEQHQDRTPGGVGSWRCTSGLACPSNLTKLCI